MSSFHYNSFGSTRGIFCFSLLSELCSLSVAPNCLVFFSRQSIALFYSAVVIVAYRISTLDVQLQPAGSFAPSFAL